MKSTIDAFTPEFNAWVEAHCSKSGSAVVSAARKVMNAEVAELALIQIDGRRKASGKLRSLLSGYPEFRFPTTLLAEQCTNEIIARFNAGMVCRHGAESVTDLTFGLGIDAFAFAAKGAHVTGVERIEAAVAAGLFNARMLGLDVKVIQGDALHWLESERERGSRYDVIYIDPARRSRNGGRTYAFDDCEPDIREVLKIAPDLADRMLVKASPMLDVDDIMSNNPLVSHLWSVGLKGECKELLLQFDFHNEGASRVVSAVEIDGDGNEIVISEPWPRRRPVGMMKNVADVKPGMWVVMPSASYVKARLYKGIMDRWPGLKPVGRSASLFVSENRPVLFPGKCLQVDAVYDSLRKAARELKGEHANTAVTGYPVSAQELGSRIGLHPLSDDSRYLIGCGDGNSKILVWCHK